METTNIISLSALGVAAIALGLQLWGLFSGKPRLRLSLMPDAPDDGRPHLVLIVTNRGTVPTTLTHMVAYGYPSRWARLRRKDNFSVQFESHHLPAEVDVNQRWRAPLFYDRQTTAIRTKGQLYVGVISSHRRRPYVVKVPMRKDDTAPKKTVAQG